MRGINAYRTVRNESAPNEELVVMCFETALRCQVDAQEAMTEGRKTAAREHLRRVREIYGELLGALDHENAPQLTGQLSRLYSWVIVELSRSGLELTPRRLDGTIRVTRNLLEGFSKAFRE